MTAQERQKAEQLLDESNRHKDTAAITAQVDALQASFQAPGAMKGIGDLLLEAGLGPRPPGSRPASWM